MKKLLLKSMLLLSALIVGSESLWATPTSATLNMTQSQTSPVVVNGVTFSWTSSYIVTGASSATSNGFCGKSGTADMIVTIPSGKKLVGISKTNGNGWGQTNINVYTGTSSSGTLVAEISQGTNSYTITSNNTGTTYYFVNSASKNAWLQSLTIEYEDGSKVATPSINGDTPFITSTEVSISCATTGATIQYSLDNGTSWTNYSAPFTLTETKTVKAKATKSEMTNSDEASATFTKVTPMTVAAAIDYIDLGENLTGQYVAGKISQIDSYASNKITYWISDDGTTTNQMEVYQGKGLNGANFTAATDLTVGDEVVVSGDLQKYGDIYEFKSNSTLLIFTPKVKAPTFSPAAGAVAANTNVTITTTTEGATIYYTTDGTNPTTTSNVYSAAITIDAAKTIKAFAVKAGHPDSDVATASYTIAIPCATPTFSVESGEVSKGTKVTISTETDGATIYYTTNGSAPTTSSTAYSGAITINSATTLKAIAVKDGMVNSEVATADYTIRDYATLPFSFNSGKTSLEDTSGLTHNGLGSDYSTTNTKLKFDSTGDYVILKIAETPGKLSFTLKGNGMSGTYKFSVLQSANGTDYSVLEEYDAVGGSEFSQTLNPASTTRYIKWIYTTKASGNVGLGNINLDLPGPADPTTSGEETYLTTSDNMAGWRAFYHASKNYSVDANTKVYVADADPVGTTITLTAIEGIPAGEAVILHTSSSADNYKMTLTEKPENTYSYDGTNKLLWKTTAVSNVYRLGYGASGVGFYPYSGTPASGAVILNVSSASGARELTIDIDDDVTGISTMHNSQCIMNNDFYNLAGQRVAQPTKGLYIVNGRKVIIK
jgi:hypothetical protein